MFKNKEPKAVARLKSQGWTATPISLYKEGKTYSFEKDDAKVVAHYSNSNKLLSVHATQSQTYFNMETIATFDFDVKLLQG